MAILIFHHPRFLRSYKKLDHLLQLRAETKEAWFREDPFDSRLDTHKLHGKLKKFWSFGIDNRNRILFEFCEGGVIFLDVGDHDIYK